MDSADAAGGSEASLPQRSQGRLAERTGKAHARGASRHLPTTLRPRHGIPRWSLRDRVVHTNYHHFYWNECYREIGFSSLEDFLAGFWEGFFLEGLSPKIQNNPS